MAASPAQSAIQASFSIAATGAQCAHRHHLAVCPAFCISVRLSVIAKRTCLSLNSVYPFHSLQPPSERDFGVKNKFNIYTVTVQDMGGQKLVENTALPSTGPKRITVCTRRNKLVSAQIRHAGRCMTPSATARATFTFVIGTRPYNLPQYIVASMKALGPTQTNRAPARTEPRLPVPGKYICMCFEFEILL